MATEQEIERGARALCAAHYADRFKKPVDDPHVVANMHNWHLFVGSAKIVLDSVQPEEPAQFSTSMSFMIGDQRVTLALTFDFVPGRPAIGPSYSSGGEPADPPEVDIRTIEWSRIPDGRAIHCHKWHKVEDQALFSLIAEDDEVYSHCCDYAERKRAEGEIRF